MTPRIDLRRVLLPLATLLLPAALQAVTIDKADNTIELIQAGSWVGGILPTSSDIVRWNNTVTGPNTVTTGFLVTYAGLVVANPGGAVTITASGGEFHLGAFGIDMSAATQDLRINGPLFADNNQTWNLAPGRAVTLGGATGAVSGSVVTLSGGTVIVTGSTNNSGWFTVGGTVANPGLLLLEKTGGAAFTTFMGVPLTINEFGTARITGTNGNQIGNSTGINVAGGTFDLNGNSEVLNSLAGTAGGKITNSNGTASTLTVGQSNASATFAGTIENGAGTLSIVKAGTGTWTLSGDSTYTGTTQVNAGTLAVTGSLLSALTLNTGGTLAGDGIVGPLTLNTGGTISPGVSGPATLDISGAFTLNGGTLALQLNGTSVGSYDQLTATGISLTSDIALNLSLGFAAGFDDFTILNNLSAGAIAGPGLFTFGGEPLSEGEHFNFAGYDTTISYVGGDGNDVVLSVPEPGSASLMLAGALGLIRRRREIRRN